MSMYNTMQYTIQSISDPLAHHSPLMSNAFSFALFPCCGVFWSSFLFLCYWISFVSFYDRSICTHSLDPLFLPLGEFQALDWLWYPLTCGPRGVHMEHKSRSKFLPWPGFEPKPLAWQSSTQPLDHCAVCTENATNKLIC